MRKSKLYILKIFVATDYNIKFNNSLVSGSYEVYLGIESEYSEIILESAKKYILANEVSFFGVIEFYYGAYSRIGLSPYGVFKTYNTSAWNC